MADFEPLSIPEAQGLRATIAAEFGEAPASEPATGQSGAGAAERAAIAMIPADQRGPDPARAVADAAADVGDRVAEDMSSDAEATTIAAVLSSDDIIRKAKERAQKRSKLEAEREEFERQKAEFAEQYKGATDARALLARLLDDPEQFADDAGLTREKTQELASRLWLKAMGDDAPEDYKRQVAQKKAEKAPELVDKKLADWQRKQEVSLWVARTDAALAHAKASGEIPHVAIRYEADPQGTLDDLCLLAAKLRNTDTPPQDVISMLEESLAEYVGQFDPVRHKPQTGKIATAPDAQQTPPKTARRSLSNLDQSTSMPRRETSKMSRAELRQSLIETLRPAFE